jgi:hypothetical protein
LCVDAIEDRHLPGNGGDIGMNGQSMLHAAFNGSGETGESTVGGPSLIPGANLLKQAMKGMAIPDLQVKAVRDPLMMAF